MVQTIRSIGVFGGEKKILIEKPHALCRIFFSVNVFAPVGEWHRLNISFDDYAFNSFYVLDGPARYFEARGKDIFQGNIWAFNVSNVDLLISVTEILH